MTKMDLGRNALCPCGSGKKYKKCCLGKETTGTENNRPASEVFAGLHEALEGQTFASIEEAQTFAEGFMGQRNQAEVDDFHGLSSEQMHRLLNFPFVSPQLVSFPDRLEKSPTAPIMTLFNLLTEAIGERGLKLTAKGNLPQKFCREAALAYWGEEGYRHNTRFGGINKEEDFIELHVTRLVAELAGLIRKYQGKFILSRDCRALLAEEHRPGLFPRLFRAYVEGFNWGYWDRYPDIHFIQRSFLFTLYLLNRYGNEWRPHSFYQDCFLRAFPMVLDEVEPNSYFPPEQEVGSCYTLRAFERFAGFLGLATVEQVPTETPYERNFRVIKLPLLDEVIRFHTGG